MQHWQEPRASTFYVANLRYPLILMRFPWRWWILSPSPHPKKRQHCNSVDTDRALSLSCGCSVALLGYLRWAEIGIEIGIGRWGETLPDDAGRIFWEMSLFYHEPTQNHSAKLGGAPPSEDVHLAFFESLNFIVDIWYIALWRALIIHWNWGCSIFRLTD